MPRHPPTTITTKRVASGGSRYPLASRPSMTTGRRPRPQTGCQRTYHKHQHTLSHRNGGRVESPDVPGGMFCGGKRTLYTPEVDVKMRRLWTPLIGLALAAAVASCSRGGAAEPTPSPTPTTPPAVTASQSPTPDMEALYAEAEWVVRRATELEEQAIRDGQGSYPTELEELLAEPYLSASRAGVQQSWELGWKGPEDESAELILRPRPGMKKDDSEVALEACFFTTSTVDANGSVISGPGLWHRTYFFKHVEGDLRLFSATGGDEVERCPIA